MRAGSLATRTIGVTPDVSAARIMCTTWESSMAPCSVSMVTKSKPACAAASISSGAATSQTAPRASRPAPRSWRTRLG
jgi:hypothetical protein